MVIVRAPMRISFVGGGTDLAAFYTQSPGRVISTAIDKYVYVTVNRTPLLKKVTARYHKFEEVDHAKDIENDRIREALLHFGITNHIMLATFNDLPEKTGLGSSSSFSVALMKALLVAQGKKDSAGNLAELASHLEIDLVKEPIGKQDQYAAAYGGINIFQFNKDHTVDVTPVHIDYKIQTAFQDHIQLFYTGMTRLASSVLTEQKANVDKKLESLKTMADSVYGFRDRLMQGDFEAMGAMLHDGWVTKKTLASNVSNPVIDALYDAGKSSGAWGGKVLGAGGGGCVMFLTPFEKQAAVREAVTAVAAKNGLQDFTEVPVRFVKAGAEVLMSNGHDHPVRLS
jgi:D-glycero-alpha-D-manno-heptose-7-phosphate kinase